MQLTASFEFIGLGILSGILSGTFGIGGGIIIVPLLILWFQLPQHTATATSLVALLGPVGIAGVYAYYTAGKLNGLQIRYGLLISVGMLLGTYLGARFALMIPTLLLKRGFCILLVFIAVRMWISTQKA